MNGPLDSPLPVSNRPSDRQLPSYDLPRVGQVYHLADHSGSPATAYEVLYVDRTAVVSVDASGEVTLTRAGDWPWRIARQV